MLPILFKIGPLTLYSWGFLFLIAFVVGLLIARQEGKRKGISFQEIIDLALYLLIGGLIFARLLYIIFDPLPYFQNPWQVFMLWNGGLSFHGGILGGVLGGWWYSYHRQISLGKLADLVTPSLSLGLAIGRVGCFLGGHCQGKVSNLPWAVEFIGLSGRRHPTQLYEMFFNLLIFAFLWQRRDKTKFDGHLFLIYLILYSFARFVVEIFRESKVLFGPITYAQVASLLIIIGTFIVIRRQQGLPQKRS